MREPTVPLSWKFTSISSWSTYSAQKMKMLEIWNMSPKAPTSFDIRVEFRINILLKRAYHQQTCVPLSVHSNIWISFMSRLKWTLTTFVECCDTKSSQHNPVKAKVIIYINNYIYVIVLWFIGEWFWAMWLVLSGKCISIPIQIKYFLLALQIHFNDLS